MLDLDAIKEREAKATKGPWIACEGPMGKARFRFGAGSYHSAAAANVYRMRHVDLANDKGYDIADVIAPNMLCVEDAEFVCAAREDIPALVAEVERLREFVEACSHGPYADSDRDSYLKAVQGRAKALMASQGK